LDDILDKKHDDDKVNFLEGHAMRLNVIKINLMP